MGMPHLLEGWTAARVRELPDDGNRYEVVDGELFVTPAPTWNHQDAVGELFVALRSYCKSLGLGHAAVSPADIELDPRTLVQPDVFVVALNEGRRPKNWAAIRELLLVVEILSPGTARADRSIKRRRFQRAGVPEYWIMDVDARLIERWQPADERPEVITDQLSWQPAGATSPFMLDLPTFFRSILQD
jgi:Uma2 family endonuclease